MTPYGMTAYLASNLDYSRNAILEAIEKDQGIDGAHVMMITTATLGEGREVSDDERQAWMARGARVDMVDLKTIDFQDCVSLLSKSDIIHICGGNTFWLLDAMTQCGFKTAAEWRAEGRRLTIVGESAGAAVMGVDIAHLASLDNPSIASGNAKGLGWVSDLLVPHYKSEAWGFGEKIDAWLAGEKDISRYTLLRDDEFILARENEKSVIQAL